MSQPTRLFLSYGRGDDDPDYYDPAKSFMRRLYSSLKTANFEVWWDREAMPNRGLTFLQEIRDAITRCDKVLLVVGENGVKSDYVRAEWEYALSICLPVIPILRNGDYSLIPRELAQGHTPDFRDLARYDDKLAELVRILSEQTSPLGKLLAVPELPANFLSRPADLKAIRSKILTDINTPTVVTGTGKKAGLQGMGGIGKSVLAAAVARDCQIQRTFADGIIWLTLGQQPQLTSLQSQLGEMLGDNPRNFANVEDGRRRLSTLFVERRCLLVLDDVWKLDHVQPFDALGPRCRMLVTTRQNDLIASLGAASHRVDVLDEPQALALLAKWSDQSVKALPKEVHLMARECGYLPLALAMVGAMVKGRPNRWASVLEALQNADLDEIERDFPDYPYPNLMRAIQVSVEDLKDNEQTRYFDLAVFPEDVGIPEVALQKLWASEGLSKLNVEKLMDKFVARSLATADESGSLRLHDLQVDYVRKRATDLQVRHERLLNAYNSQGSAWPQIKHDGYLYYHLSHHLLGAGKADELHTLLTGSPDWMNAKFAACQGDSAYAADIDSAISRHEKDFSLDTFIAFVQLYTVRQVINHRIGRYSDTMLAALAWMGREQEALSYARLRPEAKQRFAGLLTIWKIGQVNGQDIKKLTGEIEGIIPAIQSDDSRADALSTLASALTQAGLFSEAERVAQAIQFDERRAEALRELATALAQTGNTQAAERVFSEAERVAQAIPDDARRAYALSDLARALAQVGNTQAAERVFSEAERVAQAIPNDYIRAYALRELTTALAQAGQFSEAERVAQAIPDDDSRAYALSTLASAFVRSGYFQSGFRILGSRTLDEYLQFATLLNTGLQRNTPDSADDLYWQSLIALLRIIAWAQPTWNDIVQVLDSST